ncbi:MAG: hypothetical protein K8L97_16200 [Anaerolineae bacterium]|nr:hypothetical protein [Anaerolineae bacterium]
MIETVTPDTTGYLMLGLAIVFTFSVLFIGSMFLRYRSYQQDLKLIEQLKDE